jgi:hypothetical protein
MVKKYIVDEANKTSSAQALKALMVIDHLLITEIYLQMTLINLTYKTGARCIKWLKFDPIEYLCMCAHHWANIEVGSCALIITIPQACSISCALCAEAFQISLIQNGESWITSQLGHSIVNQLNAE